MVGLSAHGGRSASAAAAHDGTASRHSACHTHADLGHFDPTSSVRSVDIGDEYPHSMRQTRIEIAVLEKDAEMQRANEMTQRERDQPGRGFRRVVEHNVFKTGVCICIVLNGVAIGLEVDFEVAAHESTEGWKSFFISTEYLFTVVFTIELVLKLLGWRSEFFIGSARNWNMMDLSLVGLSFIQICVPQDDQLRNMSVLRMLRLVRMARLVKLLKNFKQLWFLVIGILRAGPVTVWGIILTTLFVYIAAVFTTKQLKDLAGEDEMMHAYFGNVPRSMFTLFQITTGDSWASAVVRHFLDNDPWMVFFFLSFVGFTQFALLNVVIAVMVEAVLKEANVTDQEYLKACEEELKETLKTIYDAFMTADSNRDRKLTKNEFMVGLRNPIVLTDLEKVGINIEEMEEVFNVIDADRSGHLSPEEFINGCLHSRGTARSKDVMLVDAKVDKCLKKLRRVELYLVHSATSHEAGPPPKHLNIHTMMPLLNMQHSMKAVGAPKDEGEVADQGADLVPRADSNSMDVPARETWTFRSPNKMAMEELPQIPVNIPVSLADSPRVSFADEHLPNGAPSPSSSGNDLGCPIDDAEFTLSRIEDRMKNVRLGLNGQWKEGLPVDVREALAIIEARLAQIDAHVNGNNVKKIQYKKFFQL